MTKLISVFLLSALMFPVIIRAQSSHSLPRPRDGFRQYIETADDSTRTIPEQIPVSRPKVAVVLSGGGAKGIAHIGALRVIEEAGIPIDIIVGTSMGSIVGGLYSIGYTPEQLDSMVMAQDWGLLLSDRTERRYQPYSKKEDDERYQISIPFGRKMEGPDGLIRGANLEMLFNDLMADYHNPIDFDDLPIPFACVASNIVDGSQTVFRKGVLPTAIRASMAIPGVFTPVYIDDAVLIDGGLVNNFPTDVARQMGADIIIGVDVQSPLRSKEELVGTEPVLRQILELTMGQATYRHNLNLADVYIHVDVSGYSSASFNLPALEVLMRRGAESTLARWDDLVDLRDKLGISPQDELPEHGPYLALNKRGDFRIYSVDFDNLGPRESKWILRKCKLYKRETANVEALNRSIEILMATSLHSNIYYSIADTLDGYNVRFHMNKLEGNSLSAGLEFDTEEIAAVQVNSTFRFGRRVPMEVSLTGRLGKRLRLQGDYIFQTSPLSGFKFTYAFRHDEINVNWLGKRAFNFTDNHHYASFSFVNMNFLRQNLRLEAGLAYQYFFFHRHMLERLYLLRETAPESLENEDFVSYFGRMDYETLDSRLFTHRGTRWSAGFEVYTDNSHQYKGHLPFVAVSASWMTAFPLSRRFSLIPSAYGRVMIGNDIPFAMLNMVGGKFFGRYMPQQMPFDGIGFLEVAPQTFIGARLQARQRIGRRHFVSASFNYGVGENDIRNIPASGLHYFGASLDYGYNFRLLPITVSFNWSNVTSTVGVYIQAGYNF